MNISFNSYIYIYIYIHNIVVHYIIAVAHPCRSGPWSAARAAPAAPPAPPAAAPIYIYIYNM